MDLEKLREQLIIDEGVRYSTYLDHLSLKTCGIGHLCREDEPEFDLELGAKVSEERVTELFEQDIQTVIQDCKKVYDDWDKLPEEVKRTLIPTPNVTAPVQSSSLGNINVTQPQQNLATTAAFNPNPKTQELAKQLQGRN